MGSLGFDRIDEFEKQLKSKAFDERNLESKAGVCYGFEKQLRRGCRNTDIGDEYWSYLTYLVDCSDQKRPPRAVDDGDDEDEQNLDPHYKMFWENLTECGKSYALEVDEGGGVCVLLKYEGMYDADEGWDWPARRKMSKGMKVVGVEELRNSWSKDWVENMRGVRIFQEKERKSSMMEQRLKHESSDINGFRKRRRVHQEDNQVLEPHELLRVSSRGQAFTNSHNTTERVKIATSNQKSVGGSKKVESLSGEKRKMNSISDKEWNLELGSDHRALRKSTNTTAAEKIEVTTPLRKDESSEKIESRRVLRSSQREMKSTADKDSKPEPRSDAQTFQRSRNTEGDDVIDRCQNIQNSSKIENRRVLRSDLRKENIHSVVDKKRRCEPKLSPLDIRHSRNNMEQEKVEVSNHLRIVQNSIKVEKSQILRSDRGKENTHSVAEKKLRGEHKLSPQDCRKSRNSIGKEKNEVTNQLKNFENKRQVDDRNNLRSPPGKGRQSSEAEKELRSKPINPASHGAKESSRRKLVGEDNGISKSQHSCDTEDIATDGCYQFFLNGIEKEGECFVFVYNGKRVRYEDDGIDNASDSEILMWDHDPYLNQGNNDPFVAAKTIASIDGEDSLFVGQFRRKIMSILCKPYNHKEYEKLNREVRLRRPIEVHREMRRPKSVSVDKLSKSYLDHHPDLRRKVQRAALRKKRSKVLNILRGFFFWLENVSNEGEGVFKPWLDRSCLAIVPPPAK